MDSVERTQLAAAAISRALASGTADSLASAMSALEELRDAGLTPGELEDAQLLVAEGMDASRPLRAESVDRLAYLVEHAPRGLSVAEAYAALTPAQKAAFDAMPGQTL